MNRSIRDRDFDTFMLLTVQALCACGFGWWMHNVGAGIFLFFGILTVLSQINGR